MKIKLLSLFLLLLSLTTLAKAENLGYSKFEPLKIGLDLDYAPLEYVDDNGRPQGLDVELTQVLMKRLNIPYTYSPNSWEDISGDVISGRVGLGMMVYSPYRKNIVNYSRAVFHLYYQVVYREDESEQFDMRHLEGKSIAYMSSRPITDTLTKAGAVLHVVRDLPKALKDLSGGRYDAVICFRYQAKYHIHHQNLKNLTTEDLTLTPREYCYVSVNRELIRVIDRELIKMEKEGVIDEIYGDYISKLDSFHMPRWVWLTIGSAILLAFLALFLQQHIHSRRLHREMLRAQKSEQLKTVFLANVSHALRTPLNAIIGFSDMMLSMPEGTLPPSEQQEMLNQIHGNGEQLLYFINELLQLSTIQSNGIDFQLVECNIGQLISEYAKLVQTDLQEGVTLQIGTQQEVIAITDPNHLRIITMHLLSNAVKHTTQGSITISYRTQDGGLYIEVKDTGNGLPDSLKDNIFMLLSDKHTFVQEQSPGLGLSICKAIIDAAHGKIGVESTEGQGATFWFWIPCEFKG
ncbi:MAG: transporter substrate-binding domain-containing protein [Prevotella sp.]|nr:transporter substrate-binding domain-containing protein [Prevotella sp.]